MKRMMPDTRLLALMQEAVSDTQVILYDNGPIAYPRREVSVNGVPMGHLASEVEALIAEKVDLLAAFSAMKSVFTRGTPLGQCQAALDECAAIFDRMNAERAE